MNIAIHAPHVVRQIRWPRIAIHGADDWKHARRMIVQAAAVFVLGCAIIEIGLVISIQHVLGISLSRAIYFALNATKDGFGF